MFSKRPFAYVPLLFLLLAPLVAVERCAAQAASDHKSAENAALAESVKQLQEQVNELRSVVADLRTESTRYRAETQELRDELHSALARPPH